MKSRGKKNESRVRTDILTSIKKASFVIRFLKDINKNLKNHSSLN